MTSSTSTRAERRSHPPLWLVEGLDIVEQRRPVLIAVTLGVVVVGVLLALLFPGIVPPVPVVGAAVGLAALLLGLAVAIALDAADLRLRGPRHVGAAGGELVAVLPTRAEGEGAATLATAVLEAREPGCPLLLGLAASGRDVRPTAAWTDALATALEAEGVSVLRIDLATGHSRSPGLLEVVRDGVKLVSAVTFGPEPRLARLGAGEDLQAALVALSSLPGRLPRDLDVLLVALPMAASRQVVDAVRSLDHVLIVAQRDRTSRVELIAGLDALEAAGTRAQVALLDDRTAARLASPSEVPNAPDAAENSEADSESGPAGHESDPIASDAIESDAIASDAIASDPTVADAVEAGSADDEPESAEAGDRSGEAGGGLTEPENAGTDTTVSSPAVADAVAPTDEQPRSVSEAEDDAPQAAPGPRAGGAFGVGGAALTAAGIAAAFETRPDEPEARDRDTEPVEPVQADAVSDSSASPTPGVVEPTSVVSGQTSPDSLAVPADEEDGPRRVTPHVGEPETSVATQDPESRPTATESSSAVNDPVGPTSETPMPAVEEAVEHPRLELPKLPEPPEHEAAPAPWIKPTTGYVPAEPDARAAASDAHPPDSGPSAPESVESPPVEASRRREVSIVHGAAEAAAIALVGFPDVAPPIPEAGSEHQPADGAVPVGGDVTAGRDRAADYPPAAVELETPALETGPPESDLDDPAREVPTPEPAEDPDKTDEIPALRLQAISEVDAEHDEMMRTTAQLSVLSDDLDGAGDEQRDDTP
jgi:hypothetical protein